MAESHCIWNTPEELQLHGPLIPVLVGSGESLSPTPYPALIDTGAQYSCIDPEFAEALDLPQVDRVSWGSVMGREYVDVYLAEVSIPTLGIRLFGPFYGWDLAAIGTELRVILGREFLRHCTLEYNGATGEVYLHLTTS